MSIQKTFRRSYIVTVCVVILSCNNKEKSNDDITWTYKSHYDSLSENSIKDTAKTTGLKSSVLESEVDPYIMMNSVFYGSPKIENIKALMEPVIERYKLPKNDDTRLRVSSVLLELRKSSETGVTEMQILTHIYLYGSDMITFPEQAALSSTLLEIENK